MAWQAQQPKELPDDILAGIIAKRIVAKKGAEKISPTKKKSRTLADLTRDLEWD
jgi:hypothetical protein